MRACDFSVFRYRYNHTYPDRAPNGFGEMERTGRTVKEQFDYLVVAPTREFADVAFRRYHKDDELLSVENLGACGDIVGLQ